jgi:choice-of-anchor B domain-containing protein
MKNQSLILSSFVLFATLICPMAIAHTEHDKARFVATSGEDKGDCKNRFRPCQTIAFAAQQADKGDTLLVAKGTYYIKKAEDIFHLVSEIVPALGGFEPLDNYQIQNPTQFQTNSVGVPQKYAKVLYERGFNIVVDIKAMSKGENAKLQSSLASTQSIYTGQSNVPCEQGQAGDFPCSAVSLLSHVPIADLSSESTSANDVWGHVDLNTMKEYALIGLRRNVVAVDVSDPIKPVVLGAISGEATTWRDIKVYQFFSPILNKWQAYAYVTADSVSEGLSIIDLNDLENGISLVTRLTDDPSAHNIYISGVDYTLNIANSYISPRIHILGANAAGGSLKSYSLSNPRELENTYNLAQATRDDYSHDASSMMITDQRATQDCEKATDKGCLVMLDFNEKSLRLWDHTLFNQAVELSETPYANAAYTHSGWWSEDKNYVFVHDELDERNFGLNTTLRVFDIKNLRAPSIVSTWTGATGAVDHNGFVRGNKYYMSNYERGLTILDISNPLEITEHGYFDTFPSSTNSAFNGAWGVYPFLPSGNILVSDIQGGLYVLKDESSQTNTALIEFTEKSYTATRGETLNITVSKQGTQAGSIDYEVLFGSIEQTDLLSANTGTLTWTETDQQRQTISLDTLDNNQAEVDQRFFVRLTNPTKDLGLNTFGLTSITLKSRLPVSSVVTFNTESVEAKEIDGSLNVQLNRSGDTSKITEVEISLEAASGNNEDLILLTKTLIWQANETDAKTIEIEIIDDNETELLEIYHLNIQAANEATLPASSIQIKLLDDESNQFPAISLAESRNVNTRQSIIISAIGSDPEDSPIEYLWSQTSGQAVSISNPNVSTMSFTAPSEAQTLTFEVAVTDDFNQTSTAQINVKVLAPITPMPSTENNSSGGGAGSILILLGLSICFVLRKASLAKTVN